MMMCLSYILVANSVACCCNTCVVSCNNCIDEVISVPRSLANTPKKLQITSCWTSAYPIQALGGMPHGICIQSRECCVARSPSVPPDEMHTILAPLSAACLVTASVSSVVPE